MNAFEKINKIYFYIFKYVKWLLPYKKQYILAYILTEKICGKVNCQDNFECKNDII